MTRVSTISAGYDMTAYVGTLHCVETPLIDTRIECTGSDEPTPLVTAAMPVKYSFFFFFFPNVQCTILSYNAVLCGQTRLRTLF